MFFSPSGRFSRFGKLWSRSASRLHSSNGTRSRTAKRFFNIHISDCQEIFLEIFLEKGPPPQRDREKEMMMKKVDFRMDEVGPLSYAMMH
jgi:hypothetical protein